MVDTHDIKTILISKISQVKGWYTCYKSVFLRLFLLQYEWSSHVNVWLRRKPHTAPSLLADIASGKSFWNARGPSDMMVHCYRTSLMLWSVRTVILMSVSLILLSSLLLLRVMSAVSLDGLKLNARTRSNLFSFHCFTASKTTLSA
jgi:hypothetical protein